MGRDIQEYAQNQISEALNGETGTSEDLISIVENLDGDFDLDSFAPYTSEEDDILCEYESEHWQEAKELLGEQTYTADDWSSAKRAYVGAVAYAAFSSIFSQEKQELIETIEEFSSEASDLSGLDVEISVSHSCPHGWASHDREDSDGTMYWESKQLDGCNAISRKVGELWLTHTWTPQPETEEQTAQ